MQQQHPDNPTGGLEPYGLQCEFLSEPLGIDVPSPRLSWRMRSPIRGDRATRHRVVVWHLDATGSREEVWRLGPQPSDPIPGCEYAGPALTSGERYEWEVTLWDADGFEAGSARSWFETGLGRDASWQASWIGRDDSELADFDPPTDTYATHNTRSLPAPAQLRRAFTLDRQPLQARLHVTARGLYRCYVNGQRVGDDELSPGWTDYAHRVTYWTYDVTRLLTEGENVLGAVVTDGWWSGFVGFDPRRAGKLYGDAPALLAQLQVRLDDGTLVTIASDEQWRESPGEIRYADLLMGEAHDAREATTGWASPGFDERRWNAVRVVDTSTQGVEAARTPPVRVVDTLRPQSLQRTPDGAALVDFGQNLVGRIRLTVRDARAGQEIVLTHAEMLDDGDLYLDNLRRAEARDVYLSAGEPVETFTPRLTVHGFRYVKVTGYPGDLRTDDVVAEVLQSDTPWTGSFDSDDPKVNQLYRNIRWGQSGNFVSVPTDCPQRDERLGWLADAQVFLPTACRNADVAAFFANWMEDVITGQDAAGAFPDVAPKASLHTPGAPAWGDAGVIVPWTLYRNYGDTRVLERAYPAMRRWIQYVHDANPDLVWRHRTGRAYGDWLQVDAYTPREVLATAYFARSVDLTARIAEVLGRDDDAAELRDLFARIRSTFIEHFVAPDGRVEGATQTAYLLALAFGLLPEELRGKAVEHLVDDITSRDYHLTTGFIGVSLLCQVLSAVGHSDVAYRLLHQESFPSWLFSVNQGATTIWERWDGWTPERGFQSANMNSFNHYSLGAVGDWLFGSVAGLGQAEDSVAFAKIVLQPQFGGRLTRASAHQETPRGRLRSEWQHLDSSVRWHVQIPPGDPARLVLPVNGASVVTESGNELSDVEHIKPVQEGAGLVCEVAPGEYVFEFPI